MFHFLPIAVRYDGSAPGRRARLPGARRADVLRRPRHGEDHAAPIRAVHPALRFNYLSTEQDRREWVEAIRVARHILNQPAMAPFNGGEISPGPTVETDEEILDWVAPRRRDRAAPVLHRRMGIDAMSVVDPLTMRVHGVDGPAGRRRVGHAVRHQRQHLRAGDDAGREGGRPDSRATRRCRPRRSRSTGISPSSRSPPARTSRSRLSWRRRG